MTDTIDIDILPTDLPYRLPADAYAYLMRTLSRGLPPPPDPSDETKALRKQSIIALISALRPNDAIEAGLAADHIVTSEQSRDASRWIHIYRANGEHKLAAQALAHVLSLMRETKRSLREIHRLQAETRKRHADPDATDTAERIEHVTMVMTAEAVARVPEPAPEPYVPQRQAVRAETPAAAMPRRAKRDEATSREPAYDENVSSHDPKSRETKTETPPRQPERPRESPARRTMLDQAQFGPRGPNWDRPMFFPDKRAAKAPAPTESHPAETTSRLALAER